MIDIKAQYSMEFILIFAFSLLIVIPVIQFMHSEYNSRKCEIDGSQAKEVLDEIQLKSQEIYYAGYPSRTTLDLYFPNGISTINSTLLQDEDGGNRRSSLVFNFTGCNTQNSLVAIMPFYVKTDISPSDGKRKILIKVDRGKDSNHNIYTYINITEQR